MTLLYVSYPNPKHGYTGKRHAVAGTFINARVYCASPTISSPQSVTVGVLSPCGTERTANVTVDLIRTSVCLFVFVYLCICVAGMILLL